MGEHESTEWQPLVAFSDDDSPSYVNGFEAGMIWQKMQDQHAEIDAAVHVENEGTLRNMANAAGYTMTFRAFTEDDWHGWASAQFTQRPAQGHLSIVEANDD